uniref:Glutathione peroxidase n=1 Tax=Oncorhynchus mykiss TaxID=8022 RepID=A0A8C7VCX6_ONCMY
MTFKKLDLNIADHSFFPYLKCSGQVVVTYQTEFKGNLAKLLQHCRLETHSMVINTVVKLYLCDTFGTQLTQNNDEILTFLKYIGPGNGFDGDSMAFMGDPKFIMRSLVCRNDISWNFEKFLVRPGGEPYKFTEPLLQHKCTAYYWNT